MLRRTNVRLATAPYVAGGLKAYRVFIRRSCLRAVVSSNHEVSDSEHRASREPRRQGARTMISLKDIRYVRLGTSNLDDAVRYATKVLGLELVRRDRGSAYMRSDSRDHTLVYTTGDARDHAVAFELGSLAEIDAAGAELDNSGYIVKAATRGECEQRWVDAAVVFADPSGNTIELITGF